MDIFSLYGCPSCLSIDIGNGKSVLKFYK